MIVPFSLLAEDDNIFSDSDFVDLPTEFDADFEDDFLDVEGSVSAQVAPASPNRAALDLEWQNPQRREKSLSVMAGNETLASTYHFTIFPQARYEASDFFVHVGLPLRFPVYDNIDLKTALRRSPGFVSAETFITPRSQDFRNAWDIQRGIRHLEWMPPHGLYGFRMSRTDDITMGRGELVNALSGDGLYDQDVLVLSGHATFDDFRFSGFLGPILKAHILGLSTSFMPLKTLNTNAFFSQISLDAGYVNDFMAPNLAHRELDAFVLNKERRMVSRERGTAQGLVLGASSELNLLSWLALKPYLSYGQLWLTSLKKADESSEWSYGGGLHLGNDAVFYLAPQSKKTFILFKSEGRLFSKGYWPGYFGSTYLIDRLVINEDDKSPTKSQYLAAGGDGHFRFGYLMQLLYAYEQAFMASLGYENARSFNRGLQIAPMRKLSFASSFLGLEYLSFHLGYQATAIRRIDEIFNVKDSRALLSLKGQFKLLPFLYLDAWAKHSFGIKDRYTHGDEDGYYEPLWLSNFMESRSFNFGIGVELAAQF